MSPPPDTGNGPSRPPAPRKTATSYMIVNRYERKKSRQSPSDTVEKPASIPAMIRASNAAMTTGIEPDDQRYTADLRDIVELVGKTKEGILPEDIFFSLYSQLHKQYREQMSGDPEYFRVKYFASTPPEEVARRGPCIPIFDEPFAQVSWLELQGAILEQALKPDDYINPRGIHIVHEPSTSAVADANLSPCSIDISLDGRGSILESTARIELWWDFRIVNQGAEFTEGSLHFASNMMMNYIHNLILFAETLGYPIDRDCALVEFFFMLDPMRTADLQNHDVDISAIPDGQTLYEFNGKSRFDGRKLDVVVSDSTGYLHSIGRKLVDEGRREENPLKGFSVGIRGDENTVSFERRFRDQTKG